MKQYFDNKSFGKALKAKRTIDLDIDMRVASKKIGISISTISRVENGGKSDLDNILLICSWLKVSICDFIKTKK